MLLGSLEVVHVDGMFMFTFNGRHGPRGLGAGNDLKTFAEGRMACGMMSPELAASLHQLQGLGEAHDWKFEAMTAHAGS